MQGIKKQNLQVDAGEAVGLQNNFMSSKQKSRQAARQSRAAAASEQQEREAKTERQAEQQFKWAALIR